MQVKAYAKLTNSPTRNAFWLADPVYKGFTFNVAEKNYSYGEIIFILIYTVNIMLSTVLTLFLLPTIFVAYDSVTNRDTVLDNPGQVQLMVIALLASIFVSAFYFSEIYQPIDTAVKRQSTNPFFFLKIFSSMVVFISCIVFANIHYVCFQPRNCLNIFKMFGVTSVSAFIFSLIRDTFPAILLMFAFPIDTFALLALHVALFYTETMIGTLVVCQTRKFWKTWKKWKTLRSKFKTRDETNNRRTDLVIQNDNEETRETELSNASEFKIVSVTDERSNLLRQPKRSTSHAYIFLCVLGVVTLCVTMFLFYVCMMCFFQLFILRNLDHSTAFSVMLKYVPTAAIGLFGFVVGKSTLVHNQVDKAEDAETFWIKLGEILSTDEEQLLAFDEEKKKNIKNLKRAFKTD